MGGLRVYNYVYSIVVGCCKLVVIEFSCTICRDYLYRMVCHYMLMGVCISLT